MTDSWMPMKLDAHIANMYSMFIERNRSTMKSEAYFFGPPSAAGTAGGGGGAARRAARAGAGGAGGRRPAPPLERPAWPRALPSRPLSENRDGRPGVFQARPWRFVTRSPN